MIFKSLIRTSILVIIFSVCHSAWSQPKTNSIDWDDALEQESDWYATDEAIRIADNVLLYQHKNGGWPKNIDMAELLSEEKKARIRKEQTEGGTTLSNITIDNGATYTQMRYLAKVYEATREERFEQGFLQGLDYLFEAQYHNGGWPQYYPVRKGYYENITFNDNAMIGVMRILRDVAQGCDHFAFVDHERKESASAAVEKGLEVILETQIEVEGKRTAWCAQYDPETLEPAGARTYEPPSISGAESVGIVEYLMDIENPDAAVVSAVEAAVDWFEQVKLTDIRLIRYKDSSTPRGYDLVVGFDPAEDSPLWARFYEIGTNYPMFLDREGTIYPALSQIPYERRTGYAWLGGWPRELLTQKYPEWKTNR